MKDKRLFKIVTAAMFAALITGLTFFPKIPVPLASGGYVHLGDTLIYVAASILPLPFAMASAAIGGGLADILSGYTAYAPFTVIIKALLTVAFSAKNEKILCKRNYAAPVICIAVTVLGYFAADSFLLDSFAAAVPGMLWNLCQALASMIVYYIMAAALDKIGIKKKISSFL